MTAPVFVDTNVLVYALDAAAGDKHHQARAWMLSLWQSGRGRVSTQVLQEFYVTVTRKLTPGLAREAAQIEARSLYSWAPIEITTAVLDRAWHIESRFQLSWWDALIVAAAQSAQCELLLTEDLQHGQLFDGVQVVNPFRTAPESA
ncbi:PIN domain-containing protein [Gemmatimonas sp.]|uniref:PIN domain-containing protein n=1 Tax=Gemmatimonas sp. TaxID=1962908 RepID=UPI00286C0B04|nr:PIN domain-containing protein [Gemmatimonas sp.]